MSRTTNRHAVRGLLFALAGFSILSVGDGIVKSMTGDWPAPAVAALRYALGAVGLAVAVAVVHGKSGFVFPRPWLQVGRGAAVGLATICFFLGAMAMPLADATAIQFTSPMITAVLSALVLRERPPAAVWGAIVLAFAGVLLVLRPNVADLGFVALFPLGAALGMAWLMIFNRKAAGLASVLTMQFLVAAMAAPLLLAGLLFGALLDLPGFQVWLPSLEVVLKCLAVAFTGSAGHFLIYSGTVRATAAVIAPATYIQLIVAASIGYFHFRDAPDLVAFAGAAFIIAGGLWLWRSQTRPEVAETPD